MTLVVVPDYIHEAINEALDVAIALCPGAASERQHLYDELLAYFDGHGVLPDFQIAPTTNTEENENGA